MHGQSVEPAAFDRSVVRISTAYEAIDGAVHVAVVFRPYAALQPLQCYAALLCDKPEEVYEVATVPYLREAGATAEAQLPPQCKEKLSERLPPTDAFDAGRIDLRQLG
jgi:hypothetical protein